ncbi:unnamed protein product, partial [Brassica napus]
SLPRNNHTNPHSPIIQIHISDSLDNHTNPHIFLSTQKQSNNHTKPFSLPRKNQTIIQIHISDSSAYLCYPC